MDRRVGINDDLSQAGLPPPPADLSAEHWAREQELIGPGLQRAVLWGQRVFSKGEGAILTDVDGRTYVDLFGGSGVNSIGHSHPKYVSYLTEQLSSWVVGGYGSPARLAMLEVVRKVLPPSLDRIQLYTSGSEAVEAALRLAKSYTKKYEFLSFWNGFHGKTLGSLGLTDGERRGLGPVAPGYISAPYADCRRCLLKLEPTSCALECADLARDIITHQGSGALAGIVVEPVQGRAGNIPPPPGYLQELHKIAREHDALLIMDETMTCFGRTGRMFSCEHDGVVPDIMIVGKGMGGGFPVTAVISSSKIMSAEPYANPSHSSSSFGGFPLACRAIQATLEVILEENLVERSAKLGGELLEMLQQTERDVDIVGSVHGRGLMIGIELVASKSTGSPLPREALREIFVALIQRGVLVMIGGNSLRLYPPLNIDAGVARDAIQIIDCVLREQAEVLRERLD